MAKDNHGILDLDIDSETLSINISESVEDAFKKAFKKLSVSPIQQKLHKMFSDPTYQKVFSDILSKSVGPLDKKIRDILNDDNIKTMAEKLNKILDDDAMANRFIQLTERSFDNEDVRKSLMSIFDTKTFKPLEDQLKETFHKRSVKKELQESVKLALLGERYLKRQKQQESLIKDYKKIQEEISDLAGKENKTIKDRFDLLGKVGKQGMMATKGMLQNIDMMGLALAGAVGTAKALVKQFKQVSEFSKGFVGAGSLLTDSDTMVMMQKTGQTATEAQSTQRALGDLGLSLEDLQSGRLTEAQAEKFEEIRSRELAKLEEMAAVAGPFFDSIQNITVDLGLVVRDVMDNIIKTFAENEGIQKLLDLVSELIPIVGDLATEVIGNLSPVLDLIFDIVDLLMPIVDALMPLIITLSRVLGVIAVIISNILPLLQPIIDLIVLIVDLLDGIIKAYLKFLTFVLKGIDMIYQVFAKFINYIIEAVSWVPGLGKLKEYKLDTNAISNIVDSLENAANTIETTNNYIYEQNTTNNNNNINGNNLFTNQYVLNN